jgi:hypothetical protein
MCYLDEIKNYIMKLNTLCPNKKYGDITEPQLESHIINMLERCLGYSLENKFEIRNQVVVGNLKADIVVYEKNKKNESIPSFALELKKPSVSLVDGGTKSPVVQLVQYMSELEIRFGILTNGLEWKLYYLDVSRKGSTPYNIYSFKFTDHDKMLEAVDKKTLKEFANGLALFHSENLENWHEQKNRNYASSEKTIFKILMEPEIIVKVQSLIKKKCEFKQTHEEVYANTLKLLFYGLNEINSNNKDINSIDKDYQDAMNAGLKKIRAAAKKKMATKAKDVQQNPDKTENVDTVELSENDIEQTPDQNFENAA